MQNYLFRILLGFNTIVVTLNYYGIRRINKYIDFIEERKANATLNEIKQTLDSTLASTTDKNV